MEMRKFAIEITHPDLWNACKLKLDDMGYKWRTGDRLSNLQYVHTPQRCLIAYDNMRVTHAARPAGSEGRTFTEGIVTDIDFLDEGYGKDVSEEMEYDNLL